MNGTNVANAVLERIGEAWDTLSPEARKAAAYVLENPHCVGVSTVRELADYAEVKPNTVVRMARALGFEGYEDFREPFRAAIRSGEPGFTDRARWLQETAQKGRLGELYAESVRAALTNIEETFAGIRPEDLRAAARAIWAAREVFVMGVGVNHANARAFTYLASTGMRSFHAIPRPGTTAIDDLAFAGKGDLLIAMTCRPWRAEVVEAVDLAREQGLGVIGISDSRASPVIRAADHAFVVRSDSPQFFPSSVATVALLETLLSFVIATASPEIVERVEKFHARRHALGIYVEEGR